MASTTRLLAEIAQTLDSAVEEIARLSRALELLRRMLRSDRCSLLFDHHDSQEHHLLSVPPLSPEEQDGARSKLTSRLQMMDEHPAPAPEKEGMYLGLPVVGLDRVAGFVLIERQLSPYSDHEIRLFSVVAAQLGGYLTMMRLHKQAIDLDHFRQEMFEVVVHDLKNPMAAVMANVDLLAIDLVGASDETRECVSDVQTACHRILRLISNLLEMARLESKQLRLSCRPVDLVALLATVAAQRAAQCTSRKVRIQFAELPERLHVNLDEDLFTRVLENILDNAVRYTPSGGRIEIRVEGDNCVVQIRIGNTGPAIPVSAQARIFEKFGQASISGRMNLGLGLYFVRLAIEAHGGRIWVEQTADLPAIFAIEVPQVVSSLDTVGLASGSPRWAVVGVDAG